MKAPFSDEVVRRLQLPESYSGVGEEIVWLVDTGSVEARAQAPLTVAPYPTEGLAVAVSACSPASLESSPPATTALRMVDPVVAGSRQD